MEARLGIGAMHPDEAGDAIGVVELHEGLVGVPVADPHRDPAGATHCLPGEETRGGGALNPWWGKRGTPHRGSNVLPAPGCTRLLLLGRR